MFHSTTIDDLVVQPQGAEIIRTLNQNEINEVSGGFVCGGLCIAGAAFAAGALFGSGVVVGYHAGQKG